MTCLEQIDPTRVDSAPFLAAQEGGRSATDSGFLQITSGVELPIDEQRIRPGR